MCSSEWATGDYTHLTFAAFWRRKMACTLLQTETNSWAVLPLTPGLQVVQSPFISWAKRKKKDLPHLAAARAYRFT